METKVMLSLILLPMVAFVGGQSTPPPPPILIHQQVLQLVAGGGLKMYVDQLPQMPKLYGYSMRNGSPALTTLVIGMYQKKWKFHRDLPPTTVFVYGTSMNTASFPGPTIIARHGTPLSVTWLNHLPQNHILPWDRSIPTAVPKTGWGVPSVVHLHGSINPPHSDGNPLAWFTANFKETGPTWSRPTYTYPNIQPPGNLWYHDHAIGLTRVNLLAGLIGAYIIQNPSLHDDDHHRLDLPKGLEFDQHLVIVDRSFYTNGSLYMNSTGVNPSIHPQWQPEYFGEAIIVNGKAWPYLTVKSRKYRFRIINASNARYFRLSLSKGSLPFYVIGSDSSYLSAPVQSPTVLLAPAEIADVVVDFSMSTVNEIELTNDAPYPYPTGTPTGLQNGKVMKFVILPERSNPVPGNSTIPPTTVSYAAVTADDVKFTRYITTYEYLSSTRQPTHLYINGLRFEDPVTETPKSGSTELWNVINLTGDNHPLHVHLGMIQAIKVQELMDLTTFTTCMTKLNDALKCNITSHATGKLLAVPDYEKTWKNVVKIEPGYMTSVVVKFKLVDTNETYPFDATAEPGYVYHCHILDHEDNAMIRPLKLLP